MIFHTNFRHGLSLLRSIPFIILSLIYTPLCHAEEAPTNTTTVYKVIKADGSVSYSDQPQAQAQKLEVAPVPIVPAYQPNTATMPNTSSPSTPSYTSLDIIEPANLSAFNSGSGNMSVSVRAIPAIKPGDSFRFILDGQVVATQTKPQLLLQTLNRGTHSLTVQLISSHSNVLLESSSSFTIHRPVVRRSPITP